MWEYRTRRMDRSNFFSSSHQKTYTVFWCEPVDHSFSAETTNYPSIRLLRHDPKESLRLDKFMERYWFIICKHARISFSPLESKLAFWSWRQNIRQHVRTPKIYNRKRKNSPLNAKTHCRSIADNGIGLYRKNAVEQKLSTDKLFSIKTKRAPKSRSRLADCPGSCRT